MNVVRNHALRVRLAFVLAVACGGCAAVDSEPFERFHESAAAFQTGADQALEAVYARAADGFRTPSSLGTDPTFSDLILHWEGDDPTQPIQKHAPLHAQLRDVRRGSYDLNAALSVYSQFLAVLAGGSKKDAARLDELARTANANLRSARDVLEVDANDANLALVSTIGAEILRQKIEHERRCFLRETMDEAQAGIQDFADFMVLTMDLTANNLRETYIAWVDAQRRLHAGASGANRKRELVIALLARNDLTLQLLGTLRTLRDGYARIPQAHAEVRASIDEPRTFLTAVRRLYDAAQRLQRQRTELVKAECRR